MNDFDRKLSELFEAVMINEELTFWIMKNINQISPRWLRYLAFYYPDARVRRECFIKSGVQLGDKTYPNYGIYVIDEYNQAERENLLIIGSRVSMGPGIHFICDSAPNASQLQNIPIVKDCMIKKASIFVEDDAWIGAGVIILPGIRIGRMSVVGAGSVVKDDVPPYTVVAGNPAKVVRKLDTNSD